MMELLGLFCLAWLGLTLLTILLRAVGAMWLRSRARKLSQLQAEVHGLLQQEQHLRRLAAEVKAASGSRRAAFFEVPILEVQPLC